MVSVMSGRLPVILWSLLFCVSVFSPTVVAGYGGPPVAHIGHTIDGMSVRLDASRSKMSDIALQTGQDQYEWRLGDGTPDRLGKTYDHTYSAPGTYQVSLTVRDGVHAPDTTSITVTVAAPSAPSNPAPEVPEEPVVATQEDDEQADIGSSDAAAGSSEDAAGEDAGTTTGSGTAREEGNGAPSMMPEEQPTSPDGKGTAGAGSVMTGGIVVLGLFLLLGAGASLGWRHIKARKGPGPR